LVGTAEAVDDAGLLLGRSDDSVGVMLAGRGVVFGVEVFVEGGFDLSFRRTGWLGGATVDAGEEGSGS
jgi:hypothetical protein